MASPVEDPGLVARHEEELGHLAVYVSGAHTILAHPDDCRDLFPMQFIKVDNQKIGSRCFRQQTGPFLCRGWTACDAGDIEEAFAMVLQVGKAELNLAFAAPVFLGLRRSLHIKTGRTAEHTRAGTWRQARRHQPLSQK